MALSHKLELRQSQSLVLTPQLLQAIKLLQLSNLDLIAYVEAELERNPLLERVDGDGEILVRSPGVFQGYFKDPELTARTIIDGWLHSGDVGEFDAEGNLKITDRKKDIFINAYGKNIAPQYIENKLKFSPFINDAVVIGDGKKYLVALIVLDEDNVSKWAQEHHVSFTTYTDLTQSPDVRKLIAAEVDQVNRTLSSPEQVKKFALLPKRLYHEDGEVTPTMKVKRKVICEKFTELITGLYRD